MTRTTDKANREPPAPVQANPSAVARMRATKAGAFARQARECWSDSTPQQRRKMIDLVRHAWRNHTAGWARRQRGRVI